MLLRTTDTNRQDYRHAATDKEMLNLQGGLAHLIVSLPLGNQNWPGDYYPRNKLH